MVFCTFGAITAIDNFGNCTKRIGWEANAFNGTYSFRRWNNSTRLFDKYGISCFIECVHVQHYGIDGNVGRFEKSDQDEMGGWWKRNLNVL